MQVAKPKKGYKLVKTSFGKYEEIPEEWESKKINDIIDFLGGFAFKSNEYSEKGKFVLRTLNIQENGSISRENEIFIPQEKCDQYKKYELKEGDTIFVMVGATFGKICENKIFIFVPPVILAESTNGFTFT